MPDEKPDGGAPEEAASGEDDAGRPGSSGDVDSWGKPKTGVGGAPDEEAAGWKGATEANRDDD